MFEKLKPTTSPEVSPVNAAHAEINGLMAQAHALGGNDSEIKDLARILEQVHNGTCTPEDGLTKARAVIKSKGGNTFDKNPFEA